MNKLLTISIAAYNVEDYIEETLDSLVTSKYIDQLEIFVVDDGGQDRTLEIAKGYQERFPQSVIPVHKENGGYGTTVNYSMEHATGKYFKLLDGDDWFDTKALDQLIEKLEKIETDVVITPYTRCIENGPKETISFGEIISSEEQKLSQLALKRAIAMWSICYKTEVLKSANLVLPSHILYTDQYFALLPFANVKTIRYFDFPIYQYRLGRDGQSVSRESRIKNLQMIEKIFKDLVSFLNSHTSNPNYDYLFYRTLVTYRNTYKTHLLLPVISENINRLRKFDDEVRIMSPRLYEAIQNDETNRKLGYFIWLCRKSKYKLFPLIKLLYPKGYPNF